jgi:hypothetical protein
MTDYIDGELKVSPRQENAGGCMAWAHHTSLKDERFPRKCKQPWLTDIS